MLEKTITRRIFIGSTLCLVTAPLLGFEINQANQITVFKEQGQFFSALDMTLLNDIAEIMIPKTSTPGASDAHVALVLDGLMLTWASDKTKTQFKDALIQINALATNTYKKQYRELALKDRSLIIEQLDKSAFANKDTHISLCYRRLKELVFHIYYTSEQANPDFKLVPGGYNGNLTKTELEVVNARGYL